MQLLFTKLGHKWFGLKRRVTRLSIVKTPGKPVSAVFGLERGNSIDRYWIEGYLARHRSDAPGEALESGDTNYIRKYYPNMRHFEAEIERQTKPEGVVCNLDVGAPQLAGRFDVFVATQVFNFVFDTRAAVGHAAAVLKRGGVMIGSVGGISQISRYDADRWGHFHSFTEQSWRRYLAEHFSKVEIEVCGNVDTACAFLNGLCIEEMDPALLDEHDRDYPVSILFKATR